MAMRPPSAAETAAAASPAASSEAGSVRLTSYADGRVSEWQGAEALAKLADAVAAPAADRRGATLWIDLTEPDVTLVDRVAATLGLHPLIAEDVVHGNQRSKIEVTDGLVHLVVFALEYADGTGGPTDDSVRAREIDLVLGAGFLLSAHPAGWDPRGGDHFRAGPADAMKPGPDHLLWAIFDEIVDAYFPFADRLEDLIDRLQDEVVGRPDRGTLEQLFALKRGLIAVRRAVSPVREILNQLTNRELELIDAEEVLYFRDIYDHVIRLADELDTDRDLVAATVEIYLSTINNNLSTIMKRLTGVTVILAGIGAIAGIFGMSEAGSAFAGAEAGGFWLVTAGVVAIAVAAAAILRRIDWI